MIAHSNCLARNWGSSVPFSITTSLHPVSKFYGFYCLNTFKMHPMSVFLLYLPSWIPPWSCLHYRSLPMDLPRCYQTTFLRHRSQRVIPLLNSIYWLFTALGTKWKHNTLHDLLFMSTAHQHNFLLVSSSDLCIQTPPSPSLWVCWKQSNWPLPFTWMARHLSF